MNYSRSREVFLVLRLAAFASLLGWGVLHMWDIPYRVFFWNERLLSPLVRGIFQTPWMEYAESPTVDHAINGLTRFLGGVLIFSALIAASVEKVSESWAKLLLAGGGLLTVVGLLTYVERAFQIAMPMEFAAQIGAPILLFSFVHRKMPLDRLSFWMKMVVALTFTGHGLYALGIFPVPANFIDMIIGVLGVNEAQARMILKFAGAMDLILAFGIFVPSVQTPFLAYAVVWGLLTTLARPLANLSSMTSLEGFVYWTAQAVYRFPHFALPLCVLIAERAFLRERLFLRKKMGAVSDLGVASLPR
jgi:hypothetical protein